MNFEEFCKTLSSSRPPAGISDHLLSLWYDGKGEWNKSHTIIQDIEERNAAWVHAYLHRKEGDVWNADYWYNRAGKKRPSVSVEEEWESLVKEFL